MAAKLGTLTLDLVAKTGSFTQPMRNAGDVAQREGRRIESSMSSAAKSIASFGAAALAGLTVGAVISAADEYTQMAAQVRNATKDTAEYDLVQKHLLETANTTYRSLKEAQQVYLDVGGALKAYGATTEEALRITDSLSFSFTHNATAVDKAKSATDAFMKSVYSGKVGSQQWITILSAIPSVVSDLSDSLRVSQEEVLRLGNAGKLSSDQLNKALDQSREKSEQLANNMSNSLADGLNTAKNGFSFLAGELNIALGVTNNMAAGLGLVGEGLSYAAKNMDVLAVAAGVAAGGIAIKMTPAIIASGVAFSASTKQAIAYQLALARMSAQAAGTTVSLTVLSAAARGALVFLTGPAGLVIAAASVAAGYAFMTNRAADLNAKLAEQALVAEKAASELSKLTGTERKAAIEDLTAAFEAQNKELKNSEFAVGSALIAVQNYAKGNVEVTRISNQARLGTISYTEAIERLNALNIPTDLYNALKGQVEQYDKNVIAAEKSAKALKVFGIEVQLVGNKAQNSVVGIDANTAALKRNEAAARGAAVTQSQYMESLQKSLIQTQTINKLIDKGYSVDRAKALAEAYFKNDSTITPEDVKLIDANIAANAKLQGTIDAIAEAKKKSSDATKQQAKSESDLERVRKQQYHDREQIHREYADRIRQIEIDLANEIKLINSANFSHEHSNGYIETARNRALLERSLFISEQEFEINQHRYTEDQKLEKESEINRLRINANYALNDELLQAHLEAESEKHTQAMAWLELEKQQRLLDSRQFYLSDAEYMQERYKLERDEIAKNMQLTQQERDARIAMLHAEEEFEKRKNLKSASIAWGQSYADIAGTGAQFQIDQERFNRYDESQALFDAQMALAESAAEREAIWQAHNDRMAMIDEDYWKNSAQLNLSYGEQITGSFADIFKTIGGEQSAAYKLMFAAQKGFAIAQSIVAIQTGIANAMALPFPENLGAAATVAAQTASIISNIQAVTLTGMAHDGIANIPEEGTWLLNKGERVLNPQDNKAFTDFINNSSSNEPVVNVYTLPGQKAAVTTNDDGSLDIRIQQVAEQVVAGQLANPNSRISKAVNQHTNAGRKRY